MKIKDLCPKPSDALQAMVDGLKNHSKREGFSVSMSTFGSAVGSICVGCAATCAIQQATGINLTSKSIEDVQARSRRLRVGKEDLYRFEGVIDSVRLGDLQELFDYYCMGEIYSTRILKWKTVQGLPQLYTDFWEEDLPTYEKLIKKLKKIGL